MAQRSNGMATSGSEAEEGSYEVHLTFALELAETASEMIRAGSEARWRAARDVDAKKNMVDLVTETDTAVEGMIKSRIQAAFPEHKFIGEETYAAEKQLSLTDEYTWCVDPIDGTMNFVHSFPYVACSIGLMHRRQPVVGVIALPFLRQTLSARTGGGAFLNRNTPLPLTGGIPQPLSRLDHCIIAAEWGSDRSGPTMQSKAESFKRLAGDPTKGVEGGIMAHALRTTGSSACNIAMVAMGQVDMYWDAGCWAWDVCAGMCIIQEVGGLYTGGASELAQAADPGTILLARRWACVRALPDQSDEKAKDIQRRLLRELYQVVQPWTTEDM